MISVRFDYNFLAPPLLDAELLEEFEESTNRQRRRRAKDAELGGDSKGAAAVAAENKNARPETESLWYMSESKV
jgi:hypothetical protein